LTPRCEKGTSRYIPDVGHHPAGHSPNNSLEKLTKTTLGKLTVIKLGSISRDAFPHRLDGMTVGECRPVAGN
jgi:hypothetical protein